MEGLETERGRRVQPERPLTGPRVPVAARRKLAAGYRGGRPCLGSRGRLLGQFQPCVEGQAPTTGASTTTTASASIEPYGWQRDQGEAIALGGGSTSTLSAVVAPGAGGVWLIAGTQLNAGRSAAATVWTSPNATNWSKTDLPAPSGERSAADGAANWGDREVVVGSVGTGSGMRAAVWVSGNRGQHFVPVPDNPVFEPPRLRRRARWGGHGHGDGRCARVVRRGYRKRRGGRVVLDRRRRWQQLAGADSAINHEPGAVVNDIVSTPRRFCCGVVQDGDRLSAALWYSSDGIHWSEVHSPVNAPSGKGDHIITSVVGIGGTGTSVPGAPTPNGLLAVGAARIGSRWQPASWISRTAFHGARPRRAFLSTRSHPTARGRSHTRPPGLRALFASAVARAVSACGSRRRPCLDRGAAAAAASDDDSWHLGLVAATGTNSVLADNIPGQPYVLV